MKGSSILRSTIQLREKPMTDQKIDTLASKVVTEVSWRISGVLRA